MKYITQVTSVTHTCGINTNNSMFQTHSQVHFREALTSDSCHAMSIIRCRLSRQSVYENMKWKIIRKYMAPALTSHIVSLMCHISDQHSAKTDRTTGNVMLYRMPKAEVQRQREPTFAVSVNETSQRYLDSRSTLRQTV
jgi:hypothetical protein